MGEFGAHGGEDFAVFGHDAHDLEEVVVGIFGEGEGFGAVVFEGRGKEGLGGFFAGDLEGEFFGEAEVDFFGGGGDVGVGKAEGEDVSEGGGEVFGEDVLGEVLAVGEAGDLEVGDALEEEWAEGDAGEGGFLEALGAGEGGAE